MTSTLNKAETKRRVLLIAKETRKHKFTRVSKEAIELLEAKHLLAIKELINSQPSMGKTIKP